MGGQVVTVSQAAAPCSYTLSPASISVAADAATGTFSMAATTGCSWTATSSAPWLTVTSGASGSGNGTRRLQRRGESEYDGADGDDQRRRADVHGDADRGGLQHDHLADRELADTRPAGQRRWR